jgi:MMPL family
MFSAHIHQIRPLSTTFRAAGRHGRGDRDERAGERQSGRRGLRASRGDAAGRRHRTGRAGLHVWLRVGPDPAANGRGGIPRLLLLAIFGLTGITSINVIVQYLAALIGLGMASDYLLLSVARWREELATGHD